MKDLQNPILAKISTVLDVAQNRMIATINQTIVLTYYEVGRIIVEEEQRGKHRAEYGSGLLKEISLHLTAKYGKGYSLSNLKQIRQFYLVYGNAAKGQAVFSQLQSSKNQWVEKGQTEFSETTKIHPRGEEKSLLPKFNLSWSHYIKLMRITDLNERNFYEIESFNNNWSVRELQRQYDSGLYARLLLSKDQEQIKRLAREGQIIEPSKDLVKDPYILEFLGLPEKSFYSETDLEQALIDKIEHFLLELGKGFTFVSRQDRITFDEKHFRIDLVFYNRLLKCFVLIDLKIGELKHQDIGQMQMYVNYFDRERRLADENPTIGIILCQDKSQALVEYTLPQENNQIFASKYMTVLPTKEELKDILKHSKQ